MEKLEDINEFYDWVIVPKNSSAENKTGITFKGDTEEYISANKNIFEMFNKKGAIYNVNGNEITILDNVKNKPIKVDITPEKGISGKVNLKMYGRNKGGGATMMVQKVSGGQMLHAKVLAFDIIKYLIDGMIDGEIDNEDIDRMKIKSSGSNRNLKSNRHCMPCGKTLRTLNGLNIHNAKVHGGDENKCENCKFCFKSKEELRTHVCSNIMELQCNFCENVFHSVQNLEDHKFNKHKDIQSHKCSLCDEKIEFKSSDAQHIIQNHSKVCLRKLANVQDKVYSCDTCDFISKDERLLKRHKRDKHDKTTKSTSPHPKKRRIMEEEDMEIGDVTETQIIDDMEVDDSKHVEIDVVNQAQILQQRSNLQDEKIKLKEKYLEEENKKREIEKKKREEEMKKKEVMEEEKKRVEKSRSKNKKRNIKRKLNNKSYIRELPDVCKKILGGEFFVYPVKGDGACGPRSAAAWMFHDQSLGPYLSRNINLDFIQNWTFWEPFFTFPFVRQLGNGQLINCQDKEELFEFLRNSNEGAYMWRGHEDFAVISNMFQVKIKIVTIKGPTDENPTINVIEPMNEDPKSRRSTIGIVPDMTILHEDDVHYNLIVPKDHFLAKYGGLDIQRKEAIENESNSKDTIDVEMEPLKEPLETRIGSLEDKLGILNARCEKLEEENRILSERLDLLRNGACSDNLKQCETTENHQTDLENKKAKVETTQIYCEQCGLLHESKKCLAEHEKTHEDLKDVCQLCEEKFGTIEMLKKHMETKHGDNSKLMMEKLNCTNCDQLFETKEHFEEHMKTHESMERKCEVCEIIFKTKRGLDNHMKTKHDEKKEYKIKQFNCDDCPFQGYSGIGLKKHILVTGHEPAKNEEECYTCGEVFKSYWHLADHRKVEHPSKKTCRYFLKGTCFFDEVKCLYNHDKRMEKESDTESINYACRECDFVTKSKNDLMYHIKNVHTESLSVCRKFREGKCERSEIFCWFSHDMKKQKNDEHEGIVFSNSGFQEAPQKAPPDQNLNLLEMITKLTLQVEKLDARTKNME